MADATKTPASGKNQATGTKPEAPKPQVPTGPVPPTGPQPAVANVPKKKRERVQYTEVFKDADAAIAEADGRNKGPRRPFKVTAPDGKEFFVVAHNEGRAAGIGFMQIGGKVEELGAKAKKPKAMGVDAVLTAINALPEDQREAILKQLEGLKK